MQFIFRRLCVVVLLFEGLMCLPSNIDDSDTKVIVLGNDATEPAILECPYEITDAHSFLTVKWFRNEKAIYQWIRGSRPSPIPDFKDEVDSSYESSKDPNKQYSSLALINPTINTTGDYKCVVQTTTETHTVHKIVQVIDVRNYTLDLNYQRIKNESQLECTVSNVFPKPMLTIISNDNDAVNEVSTDYDVNDEGYFNMTTVAAAHDNDEDADSYKCIVTFEGYNQNLTTTVTSGGFQNSVNIRLILMCSFVYISMITKLVYA